MVLIISNNQSLQPKWILRKCELLSAGGSNWTRRNPQHIQRPNYPIHSRLNNFERHGYGTNSKMRVIACMVVRRTSR